MDVRALGGWSQYFQSLDGGQKAWAKPFVVKFSAQIAGKMLLNVGQISSKGGTLAVYVNDQKVYDEKFAPPPAGTRPAFGRTARPPISIEYPSGPVAVRLENHGDDWIQLNGITIPGIGATASGHGMQDRNWALIRIFGSDTTDVKISGLALRDGKYRATIFDTTNSDATEQSLEIKAGAFSAMNLPSDCVIAISKR